ncbi:hypothetical protein [Bartonella sp. HY406]|nr:hypothetical protein [Bartonella sp. HY406]UXN05016.1 hypothetical protein N6B01_14170 [Bartonella sp. HY406]
MAILATTQVSFTKWVKFIMPLVIVWGLIAAVVLVIAVEMNWGPV